MNFRILILIVITLLLLTEVSLRIFISKPSTQQYDAELGYTNIPGSHMIESQEGYNHITFNKIGFNDDEPNPSLEKKIFIIGDSYTEAFQVPLSEGYVFLTEQKLKKQNIDLIKLARDSFVPLNYPIVSNRFYNTYKPTLTIVQTGSHTLSDLYGKNIHIEYGGEHDILDYTLGVSDADKNKESIRGIINNSALAYYLLRKYKYLIKKIIHRINSFKDFFTYKNKIGTVIKNKVQHNDSQRLSFVLNKIKGRVVVMYFPDPGLNISTKLENIRVRDIIKNSCEQSNVEFIDLTQDFEEDYKKNKRFLNGFSNSKPGVGHLNKYGHKIVSLRLWNYLKNNTYVNKQ